MPDKYKSLVPTKPKNKTPYWKLRACYIKTSFLTKEEAVSFAKAKGFNQKPQKCSVCKNYHLVSRDKK